MGIFDILKKPDGSDVDNEANEWLSAVDDTIERRSRSHEGGLHDDGPAGPAAAAALETLGLQDGASWQDVQAAREQFLVEDAADATPEQLHAQTEANLAYASLRLLRAERRGGSKSVQIS